MTDAIRRAQGFVAETENKGVLGVFVDIQETLDNLWWHSALKGLAEAGSPKNLFELVKSYVAQRRVYLQGRGKRVEQTPEKKCPQGSVLGPLFWNLVFDEVLDLELPGCEMLAFVADLLLAVTGKSRREVETRIHAVESIRVWCSLDTLTISANKTSMMSLKRFRSDCPRMPVVRLGGVSLRALAEVQYIGIHHGTNGDVLCHAWYLLDKMGSNFGRLSTVARKYWGLRGRSLDALYTGVFELILGYAAGAWYTQA